MRTFTYRLSFPPSVNHYWRRNGPRYFISGAGKEFRRAVLADVLDPPLLKGRLAVLLEFVMPDNRRRDIDNYQKAALDALSHAGVYQDDCQIDDLHVKRLYVEPPGCVDVTITEIQ